MKSFLYILIVFALFLGCRKEHRYVDDPKKSYSTPQERLNGSWKIVDYTFNGNSIYNEMNQKAIGNYNLNSVIFNYFHKSKDQLEASPYGYGDSFSIIPFYTQHNNFNDYNFLKINSLGCDNFVDSLFNYWFVSPQSFCANSSAYWKVTKLYDKDFHIVLKTDSGEYKITLLKTKL